MAEVFEARREQPKGGDRGQRDAVFYSDQLSVAVDVEAFGGIDFEHIQVFVNRFRTHVSFRADFRRDLVPRGASDHDADRLFTAALHLRRQFDFGCDAAVEGEGIER